MLLLFLMWKHRKYSYFILMFINTCQSHLVMLSLSLYVEQHNLLICKPTTQCIHIHKHICFFSFMSVLHKNYAKIRKKHHQSNRNRTFYFVFRYFILAFTNALCNIKCPSVFLKCCTPDWLSLLCQVTYTSKLHSWVCK